MVDNELITKVRTRNVKSILSNVFTSSGSSFTLSNGNGTTANGSAVDLGGTQSAEVNIKSNGYNFYIGGDGSDFSEYADNVGISGKTQVRMGVQDATFSTNYSFFSSSFLEASGMTAGDGSTEDYISVGKKLYSPFTKGFFYWNYATGVGPSEADLIFGVSANREFTFNLGSDATGDTYYRNSSGYLTRLAAGTNGHVLTLAAGIPSWAAPSAGALSGLTAASASNTINNAANAQEWQWNTLGAGTGLLLSSSSTAAASNTNTVFRVNQTGANATSTQTTYSGYFSNTKTGTSSTNVGLFTTATGGTTNLALHALGGIRLETTAANFLTIKSSNGSEWWNFDNGRIVYLNTNGSNDRITPTSGTLAFLAANATAIDHYTFTGNNALTATSGTARMMVLSKGITVSSGTTTFSALDITGTYNITGGTLTVNGIKYNPTLTSMTGATHYFLNAASGRVLLGGLPTSSAGLATGELWNNSGVINIV